MDDAEYLKSVLKEMVILTQKRKKTCFLIKWFYQMQIDWILDECTERYPSLDEKLPH